MNTKVFWVKFAASCIIGSIALGILGFWGLPAGGLATFIGYGTVIAVWMSW